MQNSAGRGWVLVLGALLAGLACGSDPSGSANLTDPALREAASGLAQQELAAALVPSVQELVSNQGHFGVNGPDPEFGAQVSATEAIGLATVYGRFYAVHIRSALEEEAKRAIRFERLVSCQPPFYATTMLRAQPMMKNHVRNVLSPQWLVTLCDDGTPVLSVAVAAQATDIQVRGSLIEFPRSHGNEFFVRGIPSEWDGAVPLSPERAVLLAFSQTGLRVAAPPRLILTDPSWIPQAAQWILLLEGTGEPGDPAAGEIVFAGLRLDGTPARGSSAMDVQTPVDSEHGILTWAREISSGGGVQPSDVDRVPDPRQRVAFTSIRQRGVVP